MSDYTFYLYDRWGKQIETLSDITQAIHVDELNGEDSLSLSLINSAAEKGQRIVWKDRLGRWHEHIVSEVESLGHNRKGERVTSLYCENSLVELSTDYVVEREPRGSAAHALSVALEGTRWEVGIVDASGDFHTSWYHMSAYDAVIDIVGVWGAELQTTIEMHDGEVVSRRVDILAQRGGDRGKIFDYGYNLISLERKVDSDDVCTALYGYGKGIEKYDEEGNPTGGYSRKLTFGDINDGRNWVGDEDAKLIWGLPDGKGGVKHTFGQVEFPDCEDMQELLELTKNALKTSSKPHVTYSAKVASFADGGFTDGEDSQTGETVHINDGPLGERITGRVLKIRRDLLDESNTEITLGNLQRTLSGSLNTSQADIDWMRDRVTDWDSSVNSVTSVDQSWLDLLLARLNEAMNTGSSRFEGTEMGTIWCSVPLATDEAGNVLPHPATEGDFIAIRIKGGALDLSDSLTDGGDFEWRPFITGTGADGSEITGILKDSQSNTMWNLNMGTFASRNATLDDARHRGTALHIKNGTDTAAMVVDNRGLTAWKGEFAASATATTVKTGEKVLTFGVTAENTPMLEVSGAMAVTNHTAEKEDATGAAKTGSVPIGANTVLHFVNGILTGADEPASGGELY